MTPAQIVAQTGITKAAIARACNVSRSTVSLLCSADRWPADAAAAQRLTRYFDAQKKALLIQGPTSTAVPPEENDAMLIRKHTVTEAVRRHFGLQRDPFSDPREVADIFLSPDIRYVREAMWSNTKHGGLLAVVGESGAGKTTLREELIDRIQREDQPVIVAQPYVLGMEENDSKGRTLKAAHIAESILAAVSPLTAPRNSSEARFAQLHAVLRESGRSGMRHVLIIEEAHGLPVPTLKHLKRFVELKDGLRPLISVILLGQPELAKRLAENDPHVREVVQRTEIVHIHPLDTTVREYLVHRFKRAGVELDAIAEPAAVEAISARLTAKTGASVLPTSMLYPLAVHNVLARAMATAQRLGAPRVTAEMVRDR